MRGEIVVREVPRLIHVCARTNECLSHHLMIQHNKQYHSLTIIDIHVDVVASLVRVKRLPSLSTGLRIYAVSRSPREVLVTAVVEEVKEVPPIRYPGFIYCSAAAAAIALRFIDLPATAFVLLLLLISIAHVIRAFVLISYPTRVYV